MKKFFKSMKKPNATYLLGVPSVALFMFGLMICVHIAVFCGAPAIVGYIFLDKDFVLITHESVALRFNECSASFKPILDLFELSNHTNRPFYVRQLLTFKMLPKGCYCQDFPRIVAVTNEMFNLQIWVLYSEALIQNSAYLLTPVEMEECQSLIHNMWEILYLPQKCSTALYDGDMFVKHSQRIFEIVGKDFGWHEFGRAIIRPAY